MKKILLFLFFILISIFVHSATATFTKSNFINNNGVNIASKNNITISCVGNIPNQKAYVTFTEDNILTISISSGNITAIDFTCPSDDYTGNMTDVSNISTSSWSIVVDNPGAKTTVRVSSITVTYTTDIPTDKYSITFIDKNNNDTSYIRDINGGEYTITKTIDNYKNWLFAGWSNDSTDYLKISSEINLTSDIILYAFYEYGNSGYVLIEEELEDWSGEYLIVNHDSLVAFNGSLNILDGVNDTINININGKTIYSTVKNENAQFIITKKEGGYSIKSKSDEYIGRTLNSNGLDENSNDIYTNNISYNSIEKEVEIISEGGAYLRYNANSNQNRFRFYKSDTYTGQKPIQLYKRTLANLYCTNPSNIKIIEWLEDSIKLDINNYDSINVGSAWELLTKEQDGSYKIYIDDLTNKSCIDLVVKTRKNGRTDCINVFKIPIFITENNADNSTINNSDSTSCDLVILKDGKLTLTNNLESRDVIVYPSGTLNIPSGKKYKVNSLTLRKDNESVPQLSYNGSLTIQNDFNIELRMDVNNWYWTALPFEFKPSMLKKSNGKTPLLDDEYYIEYYDGANRAHNQTKSFRYLTTDSTFKAGQGFAIHLGTDHTGKHIYTIPFKKDSLPHELNTSKTILGLHAWQGGNVNDRGWNLIGNPYMNAISLKDGSIRTDTLKKVIENGQWNGHWELTGANDVRYIVVRNSNGTYSYQLIGDGYYIKPFTSFFV